MIKTKLGTAVELLDADDELCNVRFIATGIILKYYPVKNLVATEGPEELEYTLRQVREVTKGK